MAGLVRAKTGLLAQTMSLSGFVLARNNTALIFSLLVNDYRASDEEVRTAVDGFVTELTRGGEVTGDE